MEHLTSIPANKGRLLFSLFLISFLFSTSIFSQTSTNSGIEIPPASIKNYRLGLISENNGVIMSCAYYAGKYQLKEFCPDLLNVLENSKDTDICKMTIWSLYQIGDEYALEKMRSCLNKHSSEELKSCADFLQRIRSYDTEILKTINLVNK